MYRYTIYGIGAAPEGDYSKS